MAESEPMLIFLHFSFGFQVGHRSPLWISAFLFTIPLQFADFQDASL
jgi:hypothetical protein